MLICSAALLLHHQPYRMMTFDSVARSDVIFFSSEIEKVESVAHTLFEVPSWMNWWLYAAWAMSLVKCNDEVKCCCLFVAGACTQLIVASTSLILANTVLKQ